MKPVSETTTRFKGMPVFTWPPRSCDQLKLAFVGVGIDVVRGVEGVTYKLVGERHPVSTRFTTGYELRCAHNHPSRTGHPRHRMWRESA